VPAGGKAKVLVNDIIAGMESLIPSAIPYVIGGVIGFFGNFLGGFSKEFFDERAHRKRHRIDVARAFQKIVTEASTNGFKVLPRDMEHVHSVLDDVKGVGAAVGEKANIFVGNWQVIAQINMDGGNYSNVLQETRDLKDELTEWCNKVKNGK
jgi:hypothetical protein